MRPREQSPAVIGRGALLMGGPVSHGRPKLKIGHLVYAKGEAETGRVRVTHGGITLIQHALDLNRTPHDLSAQVAGIADEIAAPAEAGVGASEFGP
jgi:hypothetical protein